MPTSTPRNTKSAKSAIWILDVCYKHTYTTHTCTPHSLRHVIDHDYLHKLTQKEKEWLAAFDYAYYCGKKNEVSNQWTHEELKLSYGRNNMRYRDVYLRSLCTSFEDYKIVLEPVEQLEGELS